MKFCEKCKVDVVGTRIYCPLCQNELTLLNETAPGLYPVLGPPEYKYNLILRLVAFVSIIGSLISIVLNITLFPEIWWSMYLIVTLICTWVSLLMAISKHKNILKYLLYQTVIIILFSILLDFLIGWHGWSITFVVPIMFTLAMVVMYSLSKLLHLHTGDYMIYLLMDALFGIIPIIFVGSDIVQIDIPSLICIVTSLASVVGLIIFEGSNMYQELKRRLHV